jgi:hypothetical protein
MVLFRARKHGKAIEITFINGNTKCKEWGEDKLFG